MVSKNNLKNKMEQTAARTPHYGIRKLSVGVASVLISTTLYMGATTAKADTLPSTATDAATTNPETASSSSSTQTNATVDNTAKTTVPTTASSTDTSVSTTSNAQASTTNTTAGATSSDKSSANNNSLVANNVESTANTTAQTQPKPDVVTSDKANVGNQVGSNVENKATTTTGTISAPTTTKRVVRRVRSLAAAPTANSKELVENQDYTVSNVSLEDHKKQDNFDQDATFLHADINAKDGDVIANKEITVTFNKKEFNNFWNFKNQDLIYNDQVIGNLVGDAWGKKFKIAFNDNTKGFKDINLSLKVYLSDNPYDMRDFYTNNPAKNNEKYTVRYNYQIGSTNYYVDREATIHYVAEEQPTTQTTEQFYKPISFWYAPQEWIQLDITYFTTRDGKTYAQIGGIPGKEISYDLGLGKGFITPDTKSVTISFEPSSKYYSKDANKLKISDNATFDEKTVTHRTQYDSNDLVAGFTDVYTTRPKDINEVSNKHTYYVKDLIKLDGNTLIATDATTSTGLNNLSARGGAGNNGYVGSNDVNYTIVSSDDLRKFVIDNVAKIIETRGEFLTSNSDYSNPGRIVAHNNTTGQDVYYELHNKVRVNNRNVTTPPDGAILVSAGKDIPTKVYSYTSTDIPSNVDKSKLTKEVTRTINVHNPNGTVDTTVQKVTYHQTVTVAGDEVIYNNDWTTADDTNWSEFDVPQIANYRASKDKVDGVWISGVNTQNQTVDITYTATQVKETVNGSWTIKYTDKMTGEEIMPATTIHAQFTRTNTPATNTYGDWTYVPNSFSQTGTHINFTGDPKKLDNFDNGNFDNFTFNLGLPAAPNSNYNQAYGNFAITFQLRNNSDQPDTMEKTSSVPYDKVSIKQESQTRTLTEHYVYADGDKKGQKIADDAVVEIFYSREVKSINDQVVSTSEWKLDTTKGDKATPGYHVVSGAWTNLPTTWSVVSVSAPTIQGYTTDTNETENNPGHVSSLRWVYPTQSGELNDTFMPGNKHTYEYQPEHTTYYHANNQSIKINYVDDEKGGATVKSDTLNGKTDQTVKTGITISENYSVVGTTPSEYTFKANGNTDITVHLKHVIDTTSEEKTVTRTIKVTDPTGKVTTIPQTAKVTRTVSTDKVTNQKTYGDWTTGSFDSYDVPVIEGYTATQSKVDTATVTSDTQNSEVNITYTANPQSIKINYVDSDNNDSVVKSDTLNGKTDQTVKTNINIPDGYVIEGNVPNDYTFKASGNTDITVKLKHRTTTVTPDNPKTVADKLPDNPSKNYPSGVAENDLNKTVTRTIKITDPQGKVTTETQTVHLTRTATVDEVTGKVTYGDWTTGSFDSYDVPSVEGYTASQDKVDTDKVTSNTQNSEVNVTYTANPQSIKINYIDDDKGGATVKSDALNGKTDETVKTGITIPENYTVVGTTLSEYTFKAKDNADITVHLKHVINTTSEEKTITRTIKVTNPNGEVMTIPQSAKSTRTVSTDKVTGEVTYGDWSKADLDGYDVPLIEGYTASQPSVAKTTVDGSSEDNVVEINYTPNKQVISIDYVDNGKVIATQVLTGKTDQTVKTNIQSPDKDKYVLVGNNPESYTFKAKDNADIRVEVKHVINDLTESKDVTRTIIVTRPDGKETTQIQKATVSRTVHTDAVTGAKTYDEWSKATLDKYDVPVVDGYTPSLNVVEGLEVNGSSDDSVVKVGYTANEQTAKIIYVDGDNGNSIVKSDTLTGKTDETVKTGVKVPDGYVIDSNVPTDYTFKSKDNADITVKLKHGTTTVTADNPKTTDDKLPDNPNKSYPSGVSENDLNKTVTRTIKVTDPTGKVTTETQTVHLTRTATVDEVTGKVSYDDWSTGSFGSYDVPSVDGYTASQVKVDETKVTSDTQNSEVNISYTANNQTAKVVYIDGDNGGSTVKTDILKGKTDETVKTGIKVPDGYVVESNVPTDYTFKSKDNADITVKLKHGTTTVTPDKPKTINDKLPDNPNKTYPEGVAESDLNKDVTRTIKVTDPKGKVTTTTQTVHLTRTATVDEVTGKVTYSDWSTGSFNSYDVPSVEGYTASQGKVDTDKVTSDSTNSEVNISYTANDQTVKVVYVDENNGGSTVKTETLEGKTDQTVKTGIKVPDGYVVDGQVPADYTFKAKNNADITVKLKHGTTTVTADNPKTTADKLPNNPTKSYPDGVGQNDLNKTVTRTIKVTTPDGKTSTTTQTVHLTRTATVDEVTGKVTYSDWTTGSFDSYDVPSVDGYTASQSKVDGTPVTADSSNNEVNISYTANDQSAKIVYVDNGKVVSTQVLTGKTDQTVKTNIQSPDKDKYVVVGNNPENYTFKAKDNEDIRVEVKHVVNTFKDYKNVIRSIEVTYPNGKTEKLDQVATLERTVHKDAVTGEETYSDWSTENWDSFTAPAINGYTADKDVKETVVTGNTTETTVNIVYTANEQATKIVYVDNDKSGSIVKTDTLNGKTDQTVKTDVKVPDGYVLEGNVPDNYTFTAGDNFDIIVHLRHGIVKVTPDKPKTTADKLPDSSKTYPEGVGQDDLNKTITRTIKVTTPNGKTSTTTQTAHLIRTARVDETTGQVTYDDWTTDSFDSYDVPSVDGYTASQAKVEETKVTSDSQDSEVNISYTANKQSIEVVYVDGDNSGSTVKTDTLTGKTDETVKTGIEIPDGYEVDGQVPSEYSFKAKDNADITVHLKHNTVTVIPEKPKTTEDKLPNNPSKSYPKGVAENDLNKTVVRTIKVTTPDGKTTTTKQTVKLNRVAVVDEVTGEVTYSKWSIGELDRYDVPSIEGYTPSQDRVNMEEVTSETKDSVVKISYTPNGQSINITYVDDDKGGTPVDSYILAGKTDETVKTGIEIPDGYEVEGQVPTDYTFKAKDNTDITVRLKHKLDKGTETKTVSRIVEITLPDGQTKTIKQEQTLERSKTTDLVTGDVVYGEWSKGEFDEVVVPEIDGYKPSQAKVESKVVDGASSDQVVKVTYEKIKSEAKPTAEVKNEAKVQVAPTAEAKTSAKPQAKAQPKFVTTELPQTGEKQSKGTTVGAILVGLGSLLGLGALGKRKEK